MSVVTFETRLSTRRSGVDGETGDRVYEGTRFLVMWNGA